MNVEFNTNIMYKTIDFFGTLNQVDKCNEELTELAVELYRYKKGEDNRQHIIEEMADSIYMIAQMMHILNISDKDIQDIIRYKQLRTEERMRQYDREKMGKGIL